MELDPHANEPQDPPPPPAVLPSFLLPSPESKSSTQCAVVDAFRPQRQPAPASPRDNPNIGYRMSPIPQPRERQHPAPTPRPPPASRVASSAPRPNKPVPASQRAVPHAQSAGSAARPTAPAPPSSPVAPPSWCPFVPDLSRPRSYRDPNTATEDDTESEPEYKAKKGKKKKKHRRSKGKGKARNAGSPEPSQRPRDHDQPRPRDLDPARDTLENRRADAQAVLARMSALLQEPNFDVREYEALTRIAVSLAGADSLQSTAGAGPSSSRADPSPPLTEQPPPRASTPPPRAGPSSSHAGPSTSRAGPSTSRTNCSRPRVGCSHSTNRRSHTTGGPPPSGDPSDGSSSDTDDDEDDSIYDSDIDDPFVPDRKGLSRYPGTRGKIASRAIPMLQRMVTLKGVYQNADTLAKWARNAYRLAWKKFFKGVRPYSPCPDDLLHTIMGRVSNLRTEVKKRIREVVGYLFKFLAGTSEEVMAHNKQLVTKLGHNTFHCLKLRPGKRQYENLVFRRAISVAFFWFEDTFLIRDTVTLQRLYDEGLPLPAVAFVLTMMQECIEEWGSGRFRTRDLNLTTQRGIFDAHLQGLINYRSTAQGRLHDFQVAWFREGLDYANIRVVDSDNEDEDYCQSVTRAEDVVPDGASEGEGDDEYTDSEPEVDEDGRVRRKRGKWSRI
ncbi:hypothetical protein FRC12_001089 [Ceratobasidium sp. 428]|nr:hypothetical protein FRC12_001089 [Ceratobasidium sp. 428]